jgi:hypothetical protein
MLTRIVIVGASFIYQDRLGTASGKLKKSVGWSARILRPAKGAGSDPVASGAVVMYPAAECSAELMAACAELMWSVCTIAQQHLRRALLSIYTHGSTVLY